MGRTLTITICTGLMCFALAACGDDTPQGDGEILQPTRDNPPPSRTPGTGAPPGGQIDVDDSAPPPSGP